MIDFKELFDVKDGDSILLVQDGINKNIKIKNNFTGQSGDVTFLINDGKNIMKIFKNINTTEIHNNKILSDVIKKHSPKIISSGVIEFITSKNSYFIMEAVKPISVKNIQINSLKDLLILYCEKKDIKIELFLLDIFWNIFLLIEKLFLKGVYHCDLHEQNIMITETKKYKNAINFNGKFYKVVFLDAGMLDINICPKHDRKFSSSILKIGYKCSTISFYQLFNNDENYIHIKNKIKEYYKINVKEYSDWFFFLNLLCTSSLADFSKMTYQFENSDLNFKQLIHFLIFRNL